MFELICMFVLFLSFYPHSKWSGKEEINSKMGESSKLLLCYSAIVKYMCLFCDQLTSYLPIQVSKWQSIVLESMVDQPHTDCTCTGGRIRARAIRKKDAIWPIISTAARSQRRSVSSEINSSPMDTTTTSTPAIPSPLGKGSNDHLFVLRELSRLASAAGTIALQRCTGEASIRRPIVISKRQIFPFRVRIGE